jgi:hypothetical protein
MIDIKGKLVLIIGAGSTTNKYHKEIKNFIQEKNPITIGCNYITDFFIPDIHFWGSAKRWRKYGYVTDKKSQVVFPSNFSKKMIEKYWDGDYDVFYGVIRHWKYGSDNKKKQNYQFERCCMRIKKGVLYGCYLDAVTRIVFWAYSKGVSEINIVGSDGYTFYSEKDLRLSKESQNCFGNGFTDGFTYGYGRKQDWDKYKSLRVLQNYGKKKHGFGFKIITPTVYDEFYDSNILNIKRPDNKQDWVEPNKEEYQYLYHDVLKNRQLSDKQFKKYNG